MLAALGYLQLVKILVADHSAIARERLVALLADIEGVDIVGEAADAADARVLAEKLKPDVAIVDLRMPQWGDDVLIEMKSSDPDLKVIMLTNDFYPEYRKKCLARGADYFFDKSTEIEKVVSVLRSLLLETDGA
jgi:DNA-binding NarL/FixJ family response regulator